LPQDAEWETIVQHFVILPGTRPIFDITVESVQTSCGWGILSMQFDRERKTLTKAHTNYPEADWLKRTARRTQSIDGLPTRASTRYFGGEGK
jgi:hypothetical protein